MGSSRRLRHSAGVDYGLIVINPHNSVTMSSLLRFLGIVDKKDFHKWCLENHPDKRPNDPDATRRFQEVNAEWNGVHLNLTASASCSL